MPIDIDNRIYERVEGELGVRYSPQGSDREFCTNTKNIGGGGIRIALLKELSVGTILDLEIFKYDRNLKTRCRGKIVWSWVGPTIEAGVQFLDASMLYIGKLMEYLRTQNPEDNS